MIAELSTGTSISHTSTFGLDPARLLRDISAGADEEGLATELMLRKHVAKKIYYINTKEWENGAEGYKVLKKRESDRRRAKLIAGVKMKIQGVYFAVASAIVGIAVKIERRVLERKAMLQYK